MSLENLELSPFSAVGLLGSTVGSLGGTVGSLGSTVGSLLTAVTTVRFLGSVGSLLAVSTVGSLGSVGSLLAAVSTVGSLGSVRSLLAVSTVGSLGGTVGADFNGLLALVVPAEALAELASLTTAVFAAVILGVSIALRAGGVDTSAVGTAALKVVLVLSINTVEAVKTGVGGLEVTETILASDATEIGATVRLGSIKNVDAVGNGLLLDLFVVSEGTTVATEALLEVLDLTETEAVTLSGVKLEISAGRETTETTEAGETRESSFTGGTVSADLFATERLLTESALGSTVLLLGGRVVVVAGPLSGGGGGSESSNCATRFHF